MQERTFSSAKKPILPVIIDITMIGLIFININLIVIDSFFSIKQVAALVYDLSPQFYNWYDTTIHQHFQLIDLCFVVIFLLEFMIRWIIATAKEGVSQFFFFPFVNWYDGLGCVPIAGFRWLRLLRIFSFTARLHNRGYINIKNTVFYKGLNRVTNIITEEVADRVVINTLENIKAEVSKGNPVTDRIVKEVLRPQSKLVVKWLANKIQTVTAHHYNNRRKDIKHYVDARLKDAVQRNKEVVLLSKIPIVGNQINTMLEAAIRDIVFNVIDGIFVDLQNNNEALTTEIAGISNEFFTVIDDDPEFDAIIESMINQSIDVVIKQVEIKEWKNEKF